MDILLDYENAEVILHQAMECLDMHKKNLTKEVERNPRKENEIYIKDYHSAIYNYDTPKLALEIVKNNIERLNQYFIKNKSSKRIIGINNHMGSLVTQNEKIIQAISFYCFHKDLIFIDSRSHQNSLLFKIAKKMQVKTDFRNYDFIDRNTEMKLNECEKLAENGNRILSIAHLNYRGTVRLYIAHSKKSKYLCSLSNFFKKSL